MIGQIFDFQNQCHILVQCTINGGEKGRDCEFRRNEEVARGEAS
jgi:hypothetical protein